MNRDLTDFHTIRQEHIAIHERLTNWARWARGGRGGQSTLPMFRLYRPDNYERGGGGNPIDTLDATKMQKLVVHIPEKQRWAIQWAYCYPFIRPERVCRALGVSRAALIELVHEGRTMFKNRAVCNVKEMA